MDTQHSDAAAESTDATTEETEGAGRRETRKERYDRNWDELLQELRVTQTGVQILFGFLLTLPFQSTFADLGRLERGLYLVVFALVAVSTVCNLAPVSGHRILFQRDQKHRLVKVANTFAKVSLACLALALVGAAMLVVDLVLGPVIGITFGVVLLVLAVVLWFVVPLTLQRSPA